MNADKCTVKQNGLPFKLFNHHIPGSYCCSPSALSDQMIMATSVSDREDVFEIEDVAPDQWLPVWILGKCIKPACFSILS